MTGFGARSIGPPAREAHDEPDFPALIPRGWGRRRHWPCDWFLHARADSVPRRDTFAPNAYLKITPDGKITIVVARSEMGQGVRTSLPMILAEELEADWKQITIEQAGASKLFGDQTTGGSASVRTTWDPMRKAGATAREMLISAAALGVGRSTLGLQSREQQRDSQLRPDAG